MATIFLQSTIFLNMCLFIQHAEQYRKASIWDGIQKYHDWFDNYNNIVN